MPDRHNFGAQKKARPGWARTSLSGGSTCGDADPNPIAPYADLVAKSWTAKVAASLRRWWQFAVLWQTRFSAVLPISGN